MAVYKVLQKFRDTETKEVYKENQEIELTVKRAEEAIRNLKEWDGDFLERIDNKEDAADVIEAKAVAEEKAKAEATKDKK